MQILALLFVAIGEALSILAEMFGAKIYAQSNNFFPIFIKMFLLITLAGAFLIAGYILGYVHIKKNIWVISTVSITSILILEPLVAFLVFKQLPTTGAMIGFILGIIGLIVTLIF